MNIDNGLILRTDSEGKSEESLLEEYKDLKNIETQINKEFEKINIGLLYDVNSILKKAESLLDDTIEEFIIDDKNIFIGFDSVVFCISIQNLKVNMLNIDGIVFDIYLLENQKICIIH